MFLANFVLKITKDKEITIHVYKYNTSQLYSAMPIALGNYWFVMALAIWYSKTNKISVC